jgi:uncharacterized protein (DUF488 family)
MMEKSRPIFTVGHSTHELEAFIALLKAHAISAIVDVRSQPFSRLSHFNSDSLAAALKARNVKYVLMGRELGARRQETECYVDGQAVYERVATLPLFREGIRRLVEGARDNVIALLCSEKEPLDCHRAVLICRHLRPYGMDIRHILPDGQLERHGDTERRLMQLVGISPEQGDLFANPQELIEDAYEARGLEIAYRAGLEGVPA